MVFLKSASRRDCVYHRAKDLSLFCKIEFPEFHLRERDGTSRLIQPSSQGYSTAGEKSCFVMVVLPWTKMLKGTVA